MNQRLQWVTSFGIALSLPSAWAQGPEPQPPPPMVRVLEVCQQALGQLQPLFLYAEPLDRQRLLVRLVLGVSDQPVVRLTLDEQGAPVPNGLEAMAAVARPPGGGDPQFLLRYVERIQPLRDQLLLANWLLPDKRGHRCFVIYKGRVVGVLRIGSAQQIVPQSAWRDGFQQSRIRWSAPRTPPAEPNQLP